MSRKKREAGHVRNKQSIKLFFILVLCSLYIFSFSHYGTFAYHTFISQNDTYNEGTMIGAVDISGQTKKKARTLLEESWTKWQKNTKIIIHYKEKTEMFDNSLIALNEEESLKQVNQGQRNEPFVELESLEAYLQFLSPTLTSTTLNIEKLKDDLLTKAKSLEAGHIEIQLADYLLDPTLEQNNTVGQVIIKTKLFADEKNLINKKLHKIDLAPMRQYSLLKNVEDLGVQQLSSETLSCIATGIYQVILPTNFSIIEREISEELPAYAQLGFESKVDKETNKDLVFLNKNQSSYKILLKAKDDRIVVTLKGPSFLNQYKIITTDWQTFKPKTIVQFNPLLSQSQKIVEKQGQEGQYIQVIREIDSEYGERIKQERISEDFYSPINQVEIRGLIVKQNDAVTNNGTNTDTANNDTTNTASSTNSTQ